MQACRHAYARSQDHVQDISAGVALPTWWHHLRLLGGHGRSLLGAASLEELHPAKLGAPTLLATVRLRNPGTAARLGEILRLLGGAAAAQVGVAVREAAKALDDVVVPAPRTRTRVRETECIFVLACEVWSVCS